MLSCDFSTFCELCFGKILEVHLKLIKRIQKCSGLDISEQVLEKIR